MHHFYSHRTTNCRTTEFEGKVAPIMHKYRLLSCQYSLKMQCNNLHCIIKYYKKFDPDELVHTSNPSIWTAEAGGLLKVWGQPGFHGEYIYIVSAGLKIRIKTKWGIWKWFKLYKKIRVSYIHVLSYAILYKVLDICCFGVQRNSGTSILKRLRQDYVWKIFITLNFVEKRGW